MPIKTFKCSNCGETIQADTDRDFVFCSNCGIKLTVKKSDEEQKNRIIQSDTKEYIYCFNCGQRIPITSKFCPSCKTLQKQNISMSEFIDTPQNNKKNAQTKSKKVYQHWYFWFIIIIIALCITSLFNLLNEDSYQDKKIESTISSNTETTDYRVGSNQSNSESNDDIASICDLEFVKAVVDYRNNEAYLVVTYKFTNKSDKSRSFSNSLVCKAFQDGIECSSTFFSYGLNSYSFENANKEIQPGKSLEVQDAYKLNDNKTKVEIHVELFSVWTDKVYKTFTVDLK